MPAEFTTSRRIEFRDTDAAGILHFSVYFTMMEEVEHEMLRDLGMSVISETPDGKISWPRVSATCDFHEIVRFEDVLQIDVRVDRIGEKSVTYAFRFTNDEKQVATGKLTAVCCRLTDDLPPESIPIPDGIRHKLKATS